jgi:hypothetical protein
MTDRLKQAIEHAEKVGEMFGLNIIGNTLGLIERAVSESDDTDEGSDVCNVWSDVGADILREDMQGCAGHMSDRDIGVMEAECKELAEVVTEECDTLDEIREVLKEKE